VAFADSPLPRAVVTGAPVRRSILAVDRRRDRDAARAELDLPGDRFVVAVTGGSQGSRALNESVGTFVSERAGDSSLAVLQVVGDRFLADHAAVEGDVVHRVLGFVDRIELVYAAADVLIGRGGASTVIEVAVTGIPAILVPWAASAEDHQTLNVRWLADQGAAILLGESELSRLGDVVDGLRADPPRLAELSERARRAGELHRGGALVEVIDRVARSRSRGGANS
jgi:UDP-N-acetylglucosamine--N-acetylmuramyl-(pentapeptide) pyrophosphoryl-undecaprenol N-acetylglucosamine transferase